MIRRRLKLAALLFGILAAGIGFATIASMRAEPAYGGKTLSEWLARHPYDASRAQAAIQSMGPTAVPYVVAELQARDSRFDLWWRSLARKQQIFRVDLASAKTRQERAVLACVALGTNAMEAVPHLEALLSRTNHDVNVYGALMKMGASGTLALVRAMTNTNPRVRAEARGILQINYFEGNYFSKDPLPAVRALIQQSKHSANIEDRLVATEALGWLGQCPDLVVPALEECLRDRDARLRARAVTSVAQFRRHAVAEPLIRAALSDSELVVRINATNALAALNPRPVIDYE